METAERARAINDRLGSQRDVAAGLAQVAQIFMQQGRYREADERYEAALAAARRAGDKGLEASLLQHQGGLAGAMQRYDRAVERYQRALRLFQEAGHEAAVMRTCNMLGLVEHRQGRLAEARAWYERSRELADKRQDQVSLGAAAQNIGIVCQEQGERLREQGDERSARQKFAEAERFLQESLKIKIMNQNQPRQAASENQLAQLYLQMGQLDRAEEHAGRAREIGERLGDLRGLSTDYQTLKLIAQARHDDQAAAQWAAKEQAVDQELARRARGGEGSEHALAGLPQQLLQALGQLAVTCVQAAANHSPLPSDAARLLEQLDSPDAGPLQSLAAYLRRLAAMPPHQLAQQLAQPPADLPDPFPPIFAQLQTAVQQADLH